MGKRKKEECKKMKLITLICALALVAFMGHSVQAEVQNIKVGGDVQVYGVAETDLDLDDSAMSSGDTGNGDGDYITSYVRLYLSADLTDNVGAYVRLLNERDWGDGVTLGTAVPNTGVINPIAARDDLEIELDLAYVTFTDVLGYPLDLVVGRQELFIGEGFLIADGEVNSLGGTHEYDLKKAFDAIAASIDLRPFTLLLVTAKAVEGVSQNTDCDLYGLNLTYDYLDQATFDFGLFATSYHPDLVTNAGTGTVNAADEDCYTVSVRGEGEPLPQLIPGLFLKGEVAYQWGDKLESVTISERDAWGGYGGAEYLFDFYMEPYIKTCMVIMTGDDVHGDDNYEKFEPLFSGERYGLIASDRDLLSANAATRYSRSDLTGEAMTNMRIFSLGGGLRPTESTKVDLTWYNYDVQDEYVNANGDGFGNEFDITFDYDYTEDVRLGLTIAVFNPSSDDLTVSESTISRNDTASQVVGSLKVSF